MRMKQRIDYFVFFVGPGVNSDSFAKNDKAKEQDRAEFQGDILAKVCHLVGGPL